MSAEVKLHPVASSHISQIGYDNAKHELHVLFKDGTHYTYEHVQPDAFHRLLTAESPGSHFYREIKPHHKATKVTSQ